MQQQQNLRVWVRGKTFQVLNGNNAHVFVVDSHGLKIADAWTKTGYVEFDVPPGIYRVFAGHYSRNVNSDDTIVVVGDGQASVHLWSNEFKRAESTSRQDVCPARILRPLVLYGLERGEHGKAVLDDATLAACIAALTKAGNIDRLAMAAEVRGEIGQVEEHIQRLDGDDRAEAEAYRTALARLAEFLAPRAQ